ncbi:ASCH/PUA domain-containing protein [Enterococcus faecalis]|uniref:ASCH/PUA domain-containing protein n=1 Tax=Enterococcus faecalis TaxID=1351 RepID=UPI003CC50541
MIDILENLECSTESLSYDNGYEQGVYDSLSHVILLDEPKKVVVPPMIAKFIRESDDPIYEICTWADYYGNDGRTCEDSKLSAVINWYGKNSNEFYRAVINGYEVKEEPTIHELKILPEYFEAVVSGNKRFEIRKNDRNYKKGDILRLNEYQDGQYTGDVHVAEITYITDYAQQDGYVVLGIK